VLVVDDGSRAGLISRVAESHGVQAIRLNGSRGFCVAANVGLRAAGGDIVEMLNDDTVVEAGWAAAALACFADPRVAAVSPLVLNDSGQRIDSAGQRYYLGGVARKRGHGQPLVPRYLQPCRVFGACASSAFYRRAAVLAVGGFPESFGAYFDDVDLAFRLNRAGHHIRFEPRSRVRHRGGSSHSASRRLAEQQSRNEERVFWRNIPAEQLGRATLHHLAVLAGKAYRRWQEGTLSPFVFGRLALLRELDALRRHRRELARSQGRLEEWLVESQY
jgi:GT2 family glycosyltransferase